MTRAHTAAANLLWRDTTCFDRRWKKSAAALVAVQQTLRRLPALDGREREFLELYARAEAAPAAVFSKVWRDPRAYLWARLAHEFLNSCLNDGRLSDLAQRYRGEVGSQQPREALARHLDQFKMFALGVAIHSGEDLRFETACEPLLPFAIPATPWSISASAPVAITGLVNGLLQIVAADGKVQVPLDPAVAFAAPEVARHFCPTIRVGGCELLAQPHAFRVPALREVTSVVAAGVDYQWLHRQLIIRTLETMQRYDGETFAQFGSFVSLIAVKPRPENGTSNTSHSQLPGAFMVSVADNPLTMAQDFIHEFCHNRLFAIEEQGAFFDENHKAHREARFYSPWRSDPRPLHGILHAAYVFTCVSRYWLNVYRDQDVRSADREYATQRILRIGGQLDLGIQVLQQHAVFTDLGQAIFDGLRADLAVLRDDVAASRLPHDAPALMVQTDGSYAPTRSEGDGRPLSALEVVAEHHRLSSQHYSAETSVARRVA